MLNKKKTSKKGKQADGLDSSIGMKLEKLRISVGLSRKELAEKIGITHQQLHKYEKGVNRITVGRMITMLRTMNVGFEEFFSEVDPREEEYIIPIKHSLKHVDMLRNFQRIRDPKQRESIRNLISALAEK